MAKWKQPFVAAEKADRAATLAAVDAFKQLRRDLEAIAAKAIEGSDFAPRASATLWTANAKPRKYVE